MIDINLIRENPEEMKKKLAKKLVDVETGFNHMSVVLVHKGRLFCL